MRLELRRPTSMREAKRLRVDRPASHENGEATPSPAVSVESRIHIDHEELAQIKFSWKDAKAAAEGGDKSAGGAAWRRR
jgi:hypothetical protein